MSLSGVWLPIVTPFLKGEVDIQSYRNLINHYIPKGISGIIPLGTTGESPTINEIEFEKVVEVTLETVNNRVPLYIGLGGNDTSKLLKNLKALEKYPIEGILSVCPYYNRPSQAGLFQHFQKISEHTNLNIIIYNIPYRTGVNLTNETLLQLSELENIVGVKDSSGIPQQSIELILNKPDNFTVLTGEDAFFYNNLTYGGDGGILASSHLETEVFVEIFKLVKQNNHQSAFKKWGKLASWIPALFKEPNPAPLKYCLHKENLIASPEVRLPLVTISNDLKQEIEHLLQ